MADSNSFVSISNDLDFSICSIAYLSNGDSGDIDGFMLSEEMQMLKPTIPEL